MYALFLKSCPEALESPFMTFTTIWVSVVDVSSFGFVHLRIGYMTAPKATLFTHKNLTESSHFINIVRTGLIFLRAKPYKTILRNGLIVSHSFSSYLIDENADRIPACYEHVET